MHLSFRRAGIIVLLAQLAAPSFALADNASPAKVTLDVNLASIHTERWARDTLNQVNPGLGLTTRLSDSWSLSGGAYKNSFSRLSVYALANFTPIHVQLFHSGEFNKIRLANKAIAKFEAQEAASVAA